MFVKICTAVCVWASIAGFAPSCVVAAEPGAIDLVELLADRSPAALMRAEAIYASLNSGNVPNLPGTYALTLLYIRERKLDRAAEAIAKLPTDAQKSLPFMRLRLWIEVERSQLDVAARIASALQAQLLSAEQNANEKVHSARILGGLAAIFPAADARFDLRTVEKVLKESADKETAKLAQEFRDAEKHAAEQRKILVEVVDAGKSDAAGIGAKLSEAQANWRAAEAELKKTRELSSLTAKESREVTQHVQTQKVATQRNIAALQASTEAPGRPRVPVKPRLPKKPDRNNYKSDSDYRRAVDKHRDEEREYDRDLAKYQEEQRTYPRRFADWEVKNRDWPMTKLRLIAEAQQNLADLIAHEKELRERVPTLRDQIPQLTQVAREAEFRVQVLKRLSTNEPAADPEQLLSRPSNYDILSLPLEQQRLKQMLRTSPQKN